MVKSLPSGISPEGRGLFAFMDTGCGFAGFGMQINGCKCTVKNAHQA